MSDDKNPKVTLNLDDDRLQYAREKLFLAVADMAESDNSDEPRLQRRLRDAYSANLVPLSSRDFLTTYAQRSKASAVE
jgi:hypothetical protein